MTNKPKPLPPIDVERDGALKAFLREHGEVIAWCPGHHPKLVRDMLGLNIPGIDEASLERAAKEQATEKGK